ARKRESDMAATVRIGCWTGSTESMVTNVDSEGGGSGIKFSREDTVDGSDTPVPIPSTTRTNHSWFKNLAINVTVADNTVISNRRVRHETALETGMTLSFKAESTYGQSDKPDDDDESNNGALP